MPLVVVGDELRDRHGSGGRVVELRADDRMPRLAEGSWVDVLLPAASGALGTAAATVEEAARGFAESGGARRDAGAQGGVLWLMKVA